MPLLSVVQMRELLDNPINRQQIQTAVAHERRLRLHAETTLSEGANQAITEFLTWVDSLIPRDKAQVFKSLFRYPVKSVAVADQVFAALEKVFDGRNPVRSVVMSSPEAEQDQKGFFEEIEFYDQWRFQSFERMKTAINSVLVCDLPTEQKGDRPEPYYYFLDIERVVDFEEDGDWIKWIAFKPSSTRLAYFDDEVYQVFTLKDEKITGIETQVYHQIGWCPAQFFWGTAINHRQPSQKKAPISNELGNFDWWLFHAISKQHLDMYAAYPIYWGYEQDCDYSEQIEGKEGRSCDNGFLRTDSGVYLLSGNTGGLMPCPVCSKSRLNGAGSFIEVTAPYDKESPDMRDPVGVVPTDVASLEQSVKEQQRLRNEIYTNVTGYGGEPTNDQAINEKQVAAAFEGRTTVLKNLKKNFERAEKFLIETMCKLRYGAAFVSASVDYGTEFYLYLPEELLAMYTAAKDKGLSDQILNMLQDQYYETRYRNNPDKMQRIKILTALEPFRHSTREQVKGFYESGFVTFPEFYLKVNFANLIDRFERENINVVEFGSEVDFDVKIKNILQTLYTYGKENEPKRVEQPGAAGAVAA